MLKWKLLHGSLLPPVQNRPVWRFGRWPDQVTDVFAAPNGDHQYSGNTEHPDFGSIGLLPCQGTGKYMGKFSSQMAARG